VLWRQGVSRILGLSYILLGGYGMPPGSRNLVNISTYIEPALRRADYAASAARLRNSTMVMQASSQ
jgi:hypothetical protein